MIQHTLWPAPAQETCPEDLRDRVGTMLRDEYYRDNCFHDVSKEARRREAEKQTPCNCEWCRAVRWLQANPDTKEV